MKDSITLNDLNDFKADLKDFIKSTVTNIVAESEDHLRVDLRAEFKADIADLRTELKTDIADLRTELKTDINNLREEMMTGFAGVGDAIETVLQEVDETREYQEYQSRQAMMLDRRLFIVEKHLKLHSPSFGLATT